ncbi:CFEM domain [Geosmithia morbida]|uniref:CFEM domain n=1 Tax=Geosmithia morbida TaxID=1094350 RepID=A0A9P5D1H0_9HYPO|nr:CFEM domain [Geosmithia morbida]KAF4119825.1 CFEM domain [Geosmithia morbida]
MSLRYITFLTLLSLSSLGLCEDPARRAFSLDIYAECAQGCLVSAIYGGLCPATDQTCMCTDPTFQSNVTVCVIASCSIPESLTTKNTTATACGAPARDRSRDLVILSDTLVIITAVMLVARFVFKLFVLKMAFSPDDWLVLAAALSAAPTASIIVYGTTANGLGRDIWTLTDEQITKVLKYFYITTCIYFITTTLLKMTFVAFYMRIFPSPNTRRLLWASQIFIIITGVVFTLAGIFQCIPINSFWTRWTHPEDRQCININAVAWSNAAINIALDLWVLGIPMWELRRLQLHWKKKIGVGIMFSVGAFVTIVSIIRLQSLISFSHTFNTTWEFYNVTLWSTLEVGVGVACACLPSLRLIIVRMFPVLGGSTDNKTPQYYRQTPKAGRLQSSTHSGKTHSHLASANRVNDSNDRDVSDIAMEMRYGIHYTENDEMHLVDMEKSQSNNRSHIAPADGLPGNNNGDDISEELGQSQSATSSGSHGDDTSTRRATGKNKFDGTLGTSSKATLNNHQHGSDEAGQSRSTGPKVCHGHRASVSKAPGVSSGVDKSGIVIQTTYDIQYSDNDEACLMAQSQRPGTASPGGAPGTAI